VVDPVGRHVFVSSPDADSVTVADFNGRPLKVIGSVYGASEMTLIGRTVYVAATHGGVVSRIDADTLASLPPLGSGQLDQPSFLASAAGWLWVVDALGLKRIEPSSGAVKAFPARFFADWQTMGISAI